jgi:hypothetical protein
MFQPALVPFFALRLSEEERNNMSAEEIADHIDPAGLDIQPDKVTYSFLRLQLTDGQAWMWADLTNHALAQLIPELKPYKLTMLKGMMITLDEFSFAMDRVTGGFSLRIHKMSMLDFTRLNLTRRFVHVNDYGDIKALSETILREVREVNSSAVQTQDARAPAGGLLELVTILRKARASQTNQTLSVDLGPPSMRPVKVLTYLDIENGRRINVKEDQLDTLPPLTVPPFSECIFDRESIALTSGASSSQPQRLLLQSQRKLASDAAENAQHVSAVERAVLEEGRSSPAFAYAELDDVMAEIQASTMPSPIVPIASLQSVEAASARIPESPPSALRSPLSRKRDRDEIIKDSQSDEEDQYEVNADPRQPTSAGPSESEAASQDADDREDDIEDDDAPVHKKPRLQTVAAGDSAASTSLNSSTTPKSHSNDSTIASVSGSVTTSSSSGSSSAGSGLWNMFKSFMPKVRK